MIGSLLFLTNNCFEVYNKREVRARYQESLKVSYLLTTKVEYIEVAKRCKYLVWMRITLWIVTF